jgi:ElaB/YqjD/DUF883 family membrane-anchored ribosome-binding protein
MCAYEETIVMNINPKSGKAAEVELSEYFDLLRADMSKLSETVARLASEGAASAQGQFREAANRAGHEINAAGEQVYQDAASLRRDSIKAAHAATGQLEAQIARNPIMVVLAALGIGFAIGLISRR